MKRAEEFRADFGMADEDFCRCVSKTLRELERKEERPVRKIKWSAAVALAIILLASTVGVAAVVTQWGMMDMVNVDGLNIEPEETAGVVHTEVEQSCAEGEHAVFTVKEATYDGVALYAVIEGRAKEKGVLLIPDGIDPEKIAVEHFGVVGEDATLTLKQWADKHGFERLLVVESGHGSPRISEDGSMTWLTVDLWNHDEQEKQHYGGVYIGCRWYGEYTGKTEQLELEYVLPISTGEVVHYMSENSSDFGGMLSAPVQLEIISTSFTNYAVLHGVDYATEAYDVNKQQQSFFQYVSLVDENGSDLPYGAAQGTYYMSDKRVIFAVQTDPTAPVQRVKIVRIHFDETRKAYTREKEAMAEFVMKEAERTTYDSQQIMQESSLDGFFEHDEAWMPEPITFESAGIRLDSLKLKQSKQQVFFEAEITRLEQPQYKGGRYVYRQVGLRILDMNGRDLTNILEHGDPITGVLKDVHKLPDRVQIMFKEFNVDGMFEHGPVTVQLIRE